MRCPGSVRKTGDNRPRNALSRCGVGSLWKSAITTPCVGRRAGRSSESRTGESGSWRGVADVPAVAVVAHSRSYQPIKFRLIQEVASHQRLRYTLDRSPMLGKQGFRFLTKPTKDHVRAFDDEGSTSISAQSPGGTSGSGSPAIRSATRRAKLLAVAISSVITPFILRKRSLLCRASPTGPARATRMSIFKGGCP